MESLRPAGVTQEKQKHVKEADTSLYPPSWQCLWSVHTIGKMEGTLSSAMSVGLKEREGCSLTPLTKHLTGSSLRKEGIFRLPSQTLQCITAARAWWQEAARSHLRRSGSTERTG